MKVKGMVKVESLKKTWAATMDTASGEICVDENHEEYSDLMDETEPKKIVFEDEDENEYPMCPDCREGIMKRNRHHDSMECLCCGFSTVEETEEELEEVG